MPSTRYAEYCHTRRPRGPPGRLQCCCVRGRGQQEEGTAHVDFYRSPPAAGPRGHARALPAMRTAVSLMAAANLALAADLSDRITGVAGTLPSRGDSGCRGGGRGFLYANLRWGSGIKEDNGRRLGEEAAGDCAAQLWSAPATSNPLSHPRGSLAEAGGELRQQPSGFPVCR